MEKILISACLIGDNVKFDGGNNLKKELLDLLDYYELVPFCPEMEGGLPTPRKPSEGRHNTVRDSDGKDVTKNFETGASKALQLCALLGINKAILKQRSPSCGSKMIHNGNFDGTLIPGEGITVRKLRAAGISVMDEEEAIEFLAKRKESEERGKIIKAESIARANQEKEEEEKKEDAPTFERRESRPRREDGYKSWKPREEGERRPYSKERKPYGKPSFKKDEKRPFRKDGHKPFDKGDRPGYGKSGKSYSNRGNDGARRASSRPYKKKES